jgi:hypothetical protein
MPRKIIKSKKIDMIMCLEKNKNKNRHHCEDYNFLFLFKKRPSIQSGTHLENHVQFFFFFFLLIDSCPTLDLP